MMPAALANAINFTQGSFAYGESPMPIASESNVISVDFTAGRSGLTHSPAAARGLSAHGSPEWREIATKRLSALHRLADGWDGPGSLRISDNILAKADRILGFAFEGVTFAAPPAVVPCQDGSLQLEWRLTDTRFEMIIERDGRLEGWAQNRATGHEATADDNEAIELLSRWSGLLTADKLIKQA